MEMSKIVFRVDANEQVATGHLMRCLAIADECRKRGENCLFLLAEEKETQRIQQRGYPYQVLHSSWDSLEEEIKTMQEFLERSACAWLVVDSYQATPRYLEALNASCPVLYLDDYGEQGYAVTALLHYGLVQEQQSYVRRYREKGITALAGPAYIPLREEFQPSHLEKLWQEKEKQMAGREQEAVLITTGGTDPFHIADRFLEYCLQTKQGENCQYHVIVGSMNEQVSVLEEIVEKYRKENMPEVFLHFGVTQMAELMCRCDYAISAGGTTLYELCACGVPTVCVTFADNQIPAVRMLTQQRIVRFAGDARERDLSLEIGKCLAEYRNDPEKTKEYQERMKKLVDGRGVSRIADVLCQKR